MQVTAASASVLLAGYMLFVLAVFAADLWHIISGSLERCARLWGMLREDGDTESPCTMYGAD